MPRLLLILLLIHEHGLSKRGKNEPVTLLLWNPWARLITYKTCISQFESLILCHLKEPARVLFCVAKFLARRAVDTANPL